MNDVHKRLLFVAKHRLKNNCDAYERFQFEIENSPTGQDYLLRAQLSLGSLIGQNKAILGVQATNEINQKLAEIVDLWLSRQPKINSVSPNVEIHSTKHSQVPWSKAALIKELKSDWPTIGADIDECSRNGLNVAKVKPPKRGWFKELALDWAKKNGKLLSINKSSLPPKIDQLLHRK